MEIVGNSALSFTIPDLIYDVSFLFLGLGTPPPQTGGGGRGGIDRVGV